MEESMRSGFVLGNRLISYYQVESALLEYPNIQEAGVIVRGLNEGDQTLTIFLTLEENIANEGERQRLKEEVKDYVRENFDLYLPATVQIRPKLPISYSGKIMRTILLEWVEEGNKQVAVY